MNADSKAHLLSDATKSEIEMWLAKYPANQRRSAIIPALHAVQDANNGHLESDLIDAAADFIGIPRIAAVEVATFYSMYEHKPVGKHKLCVCTNISCMLRGSDAVVTKLKDKLGIGFGETTADGKYTLKEVECLGACVNAPAMQVGNDYHENLTPEKIESLLEELS